MKVSVLELSDSKALGWGDSLALSSLIAHLCEFLAYR